MEKHFKFTNSVIALPLFFVVFLWFVFWLEIRFDYDFGENGIFPRTLSGLQGVIFSPFIHADMEHLYNNSVPLLILLAALQFFYPDQTAKVVGFGILFSGFITWVIGRSNYHIGASGLIYVLFSFVFCKGIQTKYNRLVALSLAVIVIYGGMVWYVFPSPEITVGKSISWEGHLGGLVTGFLLSLIYKAQEYKKVLKYDWEHPDFDTSQDKFMQRFDANGNFVNKPKLEENAEEEEWLSYYFSSCPVEYHIVTSNKDASKPES